MKSNREGVSTPVAVLDGKRREMEYSKEKTSRHNEMKSNREGVSKIFPLQLHIEKGRRTTKLALTSAAA